MSSIDPNLGLPTGQPQPPEPDAVRRGVSVTLRGRPAGDGDAGGAGIDPQDAMDPANQSLHDALRFTYRLVQFSMVVLGILFLLSGIRSVKEGEQGIRLLFGKRDPELLQPGKAISAPYPFGELVKVSTGVMTTKLSDAFWPYLSKEDQDKPLEQLSGRNTLKPENDGSLITADGALAHTRWDIRYRRTDPGEFSENLLPDVEERLVKAAVERGVVQAAARTNVDDLLKQSNDEASSLASRAREVAQRTLDEAHSGITIERLSLVEKMPPLYLKDKFAAVQSAAQKAQQEQEKAGADAQKALNKTAGGASGTIIALIDQYEVAIEKADLPAQEKLLAQIDRVLEGNAEEASLRVAGDVTRLLSDAVQYRSSISNQRRSDVSAFLAKQEQFTSNPLVTVHREWSDALAKFRAGKTVELMQMPIGMHTLTLVINSDPAIARGIDTEIKGKEAEEAKELREKKQKEAQFETVEGLKQTPRG